MAALAAMTVAALFMARAGTALAAEPEPGDLRQQAEQLERKARDLKADGQADRAREVMRGAEQLRAKAGKLEERGDRVKPPVREEQEVGREFAQPAAGPRELRDARAAAARKRRIEELRRELAQLEGRSEPGVRPPRAAFERGGRGERPLAGQPELQRRLEHLQVAIENLHAAGLHEPAERLAQAAESMRPQLDGGPRGMRPPGDAGAEVRELRAQVQDLRQAVRELKRQLEQMNKERR